MQETKFLDAATDELYKKLDSVGGDPLKLPPVLQPVVLLMTMQGMIDNGGFRYPLEGDFPFNPPYSVFSDAYRKIGAEDAAERLDKAIAMFPFPNPEISSELRNEFMDGLEDDDEFFLLGDAVCGDERIWQLLDQYVQEHSEAFGL